MGDVELQVPSSSGNHLSVSDADQAHGRKRSGSAARFLFLSPFSVTCSSTLFLFFSSSSSSSSLSHSSRLSQISTGEYFEDPEELEKSKKEAEKVYGVRH